MKLFHKITSVTKRKFYIVIKNRVTLLSIVMMLFLALGALNACRGQVKTIQKIDTAMGTIVSQMLHVTSDAELISDEVISCTQRLEQEYLSWRLENTEIFKINEMAGSNQRIILSEEMTAILDRCKKINAASDGAFDFSIGRLTRLWNIDKWAVESDNFTPPTERQITEALQYVGADKIKMEGNSLELPAGIQLDLGAVGKGIALDEIRELLKQREEVTGAVISVGGSILTYGSKPDGGKWNVAIVNPMDTSQNIGIMQLEGGWCVSTSGDYERYVEKDNMRYHHILNPLTGKPADSGVRSVTILTESGLDSDALSTACFVLGVEKGMALAEELEVEALFVLENGEIVMTDEMKQIFYLSNTGK